MATDIIARGMAANAKKSVTELGNKVESEKWIGTKASSEKRSYTFMPFGSPIGTNVIDNATGLDDIHAYSQTFIQQKVMPVYTAHFKNIFGKLCENYRVLMLCFWQSMISCSLNPDLTSSTDSL